MFQASASGKIILFGEHAVVYGRPAIAVPVSCIQAIATVTAAAPGQGLVLDLPDIQQYLVATPASASQPLARVAMRALETLGLAPAPDWLVTLRSTVPVASGLGSGAAAATAIVRALAAAAGASLTAAEVSALVYESEQLYHGTPSGIDNTVIAYDLPVWFIRGHPPQPFAIAHPFVVVIGDTGIASPTSVAVGDVRRRRQAEPERYERLFDAVGEIAHAARAAIETGQVAALGPLMDANQRLLQEMGVSSQALDHLCLAARRSGALGAKLSGGGRGGNMIALVQPPGAGPVAEALLRAGARRVFSTQVSAPFPRAP